MRESTSDDGASAVDDVSDSELNSSDSDYFMPSDELKVGMRGLIVIQYTKYSRTLYTMLSYACGLYVTMRVIRYVAEYG